MNKRFAIAWLVVFIAWMAASFVVHGVLLKDDYMAVKHLFRTPEDSQKYFQYMLLAHVFMAGALVWIYSRGVEAGPWVGQGVRFGIGIGFLLMPFYMIYYAVQPMLAVTVIKQMIFEGIVVILLGLIAAYFYRDGKKA